MKKQVGKISPSKWIGRVAGGLGGIVKGLRETEKGSEGRFKDVLKSGLGGAVSGWGGAIGGVASLLEPSATKTAEDETTIENPSPIDPRITTTIPETITDSNQLITNNAIGNPGMIGAVADPNQDTYGSLFAPQQA